MNDYERQAINTVIGWLEEAKTTPKANDTVVLGLNIAISVIKGEALRAEKTRLENEIARLKQEIANVDSHD